MKNEIKVLCDFLLEDEKWAIELNSNDENYNKIQLKEKINDILTGNDISREEFKQIFTHIEYQYSLSHGTKCINSFPFLYNLFFVGIRPDGYNIDKNSWLLAKKYMSMLLNEISNNTLNISMRVRTITPSILELRAYGYEIPIEYGVVHLSKQDEIKFAEAMKYRFGKIGHKSLELIVSELTKLYNPETGRYQFRTEPGTVENTKLDIPWGYLFNVGVSYLHFETSVNDTQKVFAEIINLAKIFFSIMELQVVSKFEEIFKSTNQCLEDLQRTILYDQLFSLDQLPLEEMLCILSGIIPKIGNAIENGNLYLDIIYWMLTKGKKNNYLCFDAQSLLFDLRKQYPYEHIQKALKCLSIDLSEVNVGYIAYTDIEKKNFYKYPLIKNGNYYTCVNYNFCSWGFYYALLNNSECILNGDVLGKAIEKYFSEMLVAHGIKFMFSKRYKISNEIRKELSINSQERECDFIIESKKTIFFLELKTKALTAESRSGNTLQALIDLSQSFLHGLVQSGIHEYCIRKLGYILFTDNERIDLLNRKIQRITVTFQDYCGLHDSMFTNNFLHCLMVSEFSCDDKDSLEKIKKHQRVLNILNNSTIFRNQYFKKLRHPNIFCNCRFFSISQIAFLLKNVNNNDDFEQELNRTMLVTTGIKDWFFEYNFLQKMGKQNLH